MVNPGGVVTQWVPLYDSDVDTVKSEIATFFSVFPEGVIFANEDNGGGYDLVMLGRNGPMGIDVDAMAPHVEGKFASAFIRANKPASAKSGSEQPCCGSSCCAAKD